MTAPITDFAQFAELRRGADSRDPATLRDVAGQFEALFLQSILEAMRESSLGDPLLGDSDAHELYQGMLDQQLAVEMASGRGIGLAEMLVRQLGGGEATPLPAEHESAAAAGQRPVGQQRAPGWSDADGFARELWPHAKRVAEKLGVAPEGVLAQAALETGWGQYVMNRGDGATSFNLFGIKAGSNWTGDSVIQKTLEFDRGVARQETARFRSYDDVGATFDDYAALLTDDPRYAGVRGQGKDVDAFASALQASGYATDPEYASKISRVANSDTMQRVLADLKPAAHLPIPR